jgi:hypothetical protein
MMKRSLSTAAFAGAIALFATAQSANAVVSIAFEVPDFIPVSTVGVNPAPNAGAVNFSIQTTTSPNNFRSVYDLNTGAPGPFSGNPYSVVQAGGSATYSILNISNGNPAALGISLVWGSPDFFNKIEFFNGAVSLGSVDSTALAYIHANPPQAPATGQAFVGILAGGTWTSVVFTSTTNAFEYVGVQGICTREGSACAPPPGVPLPAALPLMAGGLGFVGFLARRRKQKAA